MFVKLLEKLVDKTLELLIGKPDPFKSKPMPPPFKVQKAKPDDKKQELGLEKKQEKNGNCNACEQLAAGVKFRRSPIHTCGK